MAQVSRTAIICGALWAALSPPPELLAQSNLKDRVGSAIEAVEGACAADIGKFCGNVIVGILAGLVILLKWPLSGLWVFGLVVGIDLLLHAVWWVVSGWQEREKFRPSPKRFLLCGR
jgi:tetrahydromethanopterin S-methyltransferase subunit G